MATQRTDSPNTESRAPRSPIVTPEGSTTPAGVSQSNEISAHSLQPVEPAVKPSVGSDDDRAARDARIAEAAYYRAERRGFAEGHEIEDWLAAESEIDREAH